MFGTIIFNLFIQPLELIFEIIFYNLKSYPGLAIIAISLVMNFLALPLYKRADDIQAEERDKVASMSKWVNHIKKTFKGDERYMMLTEYYRSQNYKQLYSLRSSFPLLLQVPFFIAAYHYLSNLDALNGVSFLFLKDLGTPDQLINLGSFSVNLMPIIMTLINVVSAFIYLRGFPIKDKIQTYGIAVIFLILLYDSPSGLVFYWTCNQIFSVCKNIVMKLVAPLAIKNKAKAGSASAVKNRKFSRKPLKVSTFLLGGLFISILLGILIPITVISSSPTEFTLDTGKVVTWIVNTFTISLGFFVIWLGIYYYLGKTTFRAILTYAVWIMSGVFVINYMLFQNDYGFMNSELVYSSAIQISGSEKLINLVVVIAVAVALAVALYFFGKHINYAYIILLIGAVGLSSVNMVKSFDEIDVAVQKEKASQSIEENEKVFHFSKDGQNVVVFMMDRAVSGMLPFILDENPELAQQFSGFTYYPNTLSHGKYTNYTTPALFGGYEYTVGASNERSDISLAEKQNQALTLMPTLFSDAGYDVTVCDPPYAGYTDPGDLSIYDGIENVSAYNLSGKYTEEAFPQLEPYIEEIRKHNFFMYSVFSVVPTCVKGFVYNGGYYMSTNNLSCGKQFLNNYSVLKKLVDLTDTTDEGNQFLMIQNATSHEPATLQTPDYEPVLKVTSDPYQGEPVRTLENGAYIDLTQYTGVQAYHSNMAALKQVGNWLDYLKELGVYDNTRIIIVADHGSFDTALTQLCQWDDQMQDWLNIVSFNPLLMVKDFNETGDIKTDDTFMTNADVPSLAMDDVIENPVNPYTGNAVNMDAKSRPQMVTTADHLHIDENNGNTFNEEGAHHYLVTDNIFDLNNWKYQGPVDSK